MSDDGDAGRGRWLTIGLEMGIGALLGVFVGKWLDGKFGSNPWGVLVCTFLGLAAGMYQLIKEGIKANKD